MRVTWLTVNLPRRKPACSLFGCVSKTGVEELVLHAEDGDAVESPACVTPKFICNDVIARLAKWRVLATTGVCASARTELKRQRFLDIGVTDLCGKMVLVFSEIARLLFLLL